MLSKKHGCADYYNVKAIDSILKDSSNSKIVAIFKDYLILDDISCECLKRYYNTEECLERLPSLCEFYMGYAEIFPSYALLLQPTADETREIAYNKEGMAKYMYKNIRKK